MKFKGNKSSGKVILLTALITVILSTISISVQKKLGNVDSGMTVYKINKDVETGYEIDKEKDLVEEKISISEDSTNYIKNRNEVDGQVVISTIYKNEKVNKKRLANKNDPGIFMADSELDRRFSIPVAYIDDQYSLTFREGDIVDIVFTEVNGSGVKANINSEVVLTNARVVGAINSSGKFLSAKDNNELANSIVFESTTDQILNVSEKQYQGKFKFIKVPDSKK